MCSKVTAPRILYGQINICEGCARKDSGGSTGNLTGMKAVPVIIPVVLRAT